MKEKFSVLDLLRFALALYLTLFHSIHQYPQSRDVPLIDLAGMGGFVTSTFFILSGFILAHVYFGESVSMRGGFRQFFIKRLSNLYVIHFVGLLFFFAVALVSTHAVTSFALMSLDDRPEVTVALTPAVTTLNVVLNALLLQVWNPLYGSINPSSWSLAVLLFFYLTFPFAAPRLLAARSKPLILSLLWGAYLMPPILAGVFHWYEPVAVGTILRNPVLRLPEFFAGILLYGMFREGMLAPIASTSGRRVAALLFAGGCFVWGAWLLAHGAGYWRYLVHNGAMMPAEIALIAVCAQVKVPAQCERFASRLGNSALSIFVIHAPIFMVMMKATKLLSMGISPFRCAAHFAACAAASKDIVPGMGSLPLYLIATAIAAVFFQEHVVVPLRDAVRRKLLSNGYAQAESEATSA